MSRSSLHCFGGRVAATILVVDDEQSVLDYVAKNLTSSGYSVATALSGEDALALVQQRSLMPEILVADLVLPGMTGFALADALRRTNRELKTLFISGYTGAEYFRQMELSSTDIPFLQKPFTVAALLGKVQELATERSTKKGQA